MVRELLSASGLEKRKISLDAHHCNPTTLSQIAVAGGTYITQIKDNQPILLEQCKKLALEEKGTFSYENHDKDLGQLTSRHANIYPINIVPLDLTFRILNINRLEIF